MQETQRNLTHKGKIALANEAIERRPESVKNGSFRLRYHLMPPSGWMNDPNGLIQWNGEYHVFYQHDPFQPKQGPMHWGHAISTDLVHWTHLPVALAPSEPYDCGESGGYGCWSGSAVDDNGVLSLVYTGHVDGRNPVEVQCLTTSADGVHFTKHPAGPIIPGPPEEGGFGFRDPKVWKYEDVWYMVVGYGKDGLGKALLYASDDLRKWRYVGVAAESDGTMGNMWECPDLFPLGDHGRHVLIVSPMNMGAAKTLYMTGDFDYGSGRFHRRHYARLDYGFDFYAPQTMLDSRGRTILFGWMNIWGARMPEQAEGWMGAMTVPRELTLAADGTVRMLPVPELEALRGSHTAIGGLEIDADTFIPLPEIRGDTLEIIAVFDTAASDEAEFGLRIRCSEDGSEFTEIVYRKADRKLLMDRSRSGIGDGGVSEVPLSPMEDGRIKLRLFIDRSSVELFANDGRITVTNRIYPDPSSTAVRLFARQGAGVLECLDAWEMKSIWPET
ncbi:MAG TPA: glycoside hydrolase family 32 protein [Paenibacillus sp.]|uniref:glycoside hydrolase family 32 protein n=1 Tax=Paenibacillus sp. TaxID=58172 RepID=UPI002CC69937|nr:glycoside hydrolase family 32 protein [Paenibacillus sp.]HUC90746.1 glycoside hydrolase family 32 protein [Paenibacillus sp.]